ncbi:hypothetical protein [Rhizobium sp. Root708]|uniref:hypothetical protein n=1 Tax=Rhizobium sp. Root708 TaxID=1736592 RepID=UPI0009EA9CC0|nr:hypothetical protein [Rhizobium sp. Root708]
MSEPAHVRAGLLRESFPGERRVALTPDDIRRLSSRFTFLFEPGCGESAGYSDPDYMKAGAHAAAPADVVQCDLVVSVRRPERSVPNHTATVFLGSSARAANTSLGPSLELELARLEGFADAAAMDAATTQATVLGHAAVLEGVRLMKIGHSMLTLEGSFVRPIRMAAIGVNTASLQAIATARKLGALTHVFGLSEIDRAKVERLGAKFSAIDTAILAAGLKPEQARRQLGRQLASMQMIVTNLHESGSAAPVLIDEETLSSLPPGSVIIDLAAANGGNCAFTRIDQTVTAHAVSIVGSTLLASNEAAEASRLFSDCVRRLLEHLVEPGEHLWLQRKDAVLDRLMGRSDGEKPRAS